MDVVQAALSRSASGSLGAPAAAFAAGIATSFGPCVAGRFLALCAVVGVPGSAQRWVRVAAFIAGVVGACTAVAFSVSLVSRSARYTADVYIAFAALFAFGGVRILLARERACGHAALRRGTSVGASFLAGASFAFVLSPCCAPVVSSLALFAAAAGSPAFTLAVVAAFCAGHATPLAAAGFGTKLLGERLERGGLSNAAAVVSGALMLAMSGYYAVLA